MVFILSRRVALSCIAFSCLTLQACDGTQSSPPDDFLVSDITTKINAHQASAQQGSPLSKYLTLNGVVIKGKQVEGDKAIVIAEITATCTHNYHEMYIRSLMGNQGCENAGIVLKNEITLPYIRFDTGWRYQGHIFKS